MWVTRKSVASPPPRAAVRSQPTPDGERSRRAETGAPRGAEDDIVVFDDLGDMSFSDAIDATIVEFDEGGLVSGTVVKIDNDEVLLDIGFKSEGVIPSRELSIRNDVNPSEVVSLGEELEALVLQKEDKDGRLILSKKRAQYERAWGTIEKLKEEEGVVSGPVIEVVKGGLILDIGLRGFLPASLVDLRRVRDLAPFVGKTLEAKIIELDKNRNNVVLSRRAYLEETQREQRDEFLTNLKPGEVRQGVVSSVVNFGAFVDLGGMDGLVHVSELSWKHVDHPSSVVNVGDEVTVQVLDVDLSRERISLSLKATQQDPWQEFADRSPGRGARLRPGHQAGAVRRVRAGRRGHRGPGPHLRDGGPPRRGARAGRHPRRGAVGEDHRHRPRPPADLAVDQAGRRGRRGRGRVPGPVRRAQLRRRGQLHRRPGRGRRPSTSSEAEADAPSRGRAARGRVELDAAALDAVEAVAVEGAAADAAPETPTRVAPPRPGEPLRAPWAVAAYPHLSPVLSHSRFVGGLALCVTTA